jgi:hypothetical protein
MSTNQRRYQEGVGNMRRSRSLSRPWTSFASHLEENIFCRTPFLRFGIARIGFIRGSRELSKIPARCRSRLCAKAVLISCVAWPARC